MSDQSPLRCSVIVPVYEHWHLIPKLLRCLAKQTVDQQAFEVLLVDNGSQFFEPPKVLPTNVQVLHCESPGSYAARNMAIAHAKGDWLIFTDADCLPQAGWLEALMQRAEKLGDSNVVLAGAIQMRASGPKPSIYEMYDLVKGIPQEWYVSRGYAVTANLALPASLCEQLGGFDASRFSGGDADLCRRAVASGAALHYVDQAVVEHPARTSWAAIATKARRVKGGQLTAGSPRQRILWLARTFTPPLVAWYRFLVSSRQPFFYRLMASILQVRLWGVEAYETLRLLFRGTAERR